MILSKVMISTSLLCSNIVNIFYLTHEFWILHKSYDITNNFILDNRKQTLVYQKSFSATAELIVHILTDQTNQINCFLWSK